MRIVKGLAYMILFGVICMISALALITPAEALGLNSHFFYGLIGMVWVSLKLGNLADWLFERLWARVMS